MTSFEARPVIVAEPPPPQYGPAAPPDWPPEEGPDERRRLRISDLRVVKTLQPLRPGTIKLCRRFGDALLCVRYRQDAPGMRRYTTVELIIDEAPITGPRIAQRTFHVRIGRLETALQVLARANGARFDPRSKLWMMKGSTVRRLGLEQRVQARKL